MPEIEVSGTSARHSRVQSFHDQDAQAAAVDELIGDEVERPAIVRPLRDQHRRPRAQGAFASTSPADHEAFLAIQSEQPLMVHDEALPAQQNVQAPIAEAPALMSQSQQPSSQFGIGRPA